METCKPCEHMMPISWTQTCHHPDILHREIFTFLREENEDFPPIPDWCPFKHPLLSKTLEERRIP